MKWVAVVLLAVAVAGGVWLTTHVEPYRVYVVGDFDGRARGWEVLLPWAARPVLAAYGAPVLALACALVCSISHQAAISEDIRGLWRRATLRIMNRHPASFTQARELATVLSTSLARRRQRPIHAKVRSTTQRRDKTVNPLAPLGLGTISINSDTPKSFSASCSFGPA